MVYTTPMSDNTFERPLQRVWPTTTELLAAQKAVIEATVGTDLPNLPYEYAEQARHEEMEAWRRNVEGRQSRDALLRQEMSHRSLASLFP